MEFIDELAGDAEELAIDCLCLHIAELILEENGVEFEDMREREEVGLWGIELEDVEEGEVGVESSVVIDIDCAEGVDIDARIFIDFSMILTGDIIHNFFLVEAGGQQWMVEHEQFSNIFLIDDKKRLNFLPTIQDQLIPS